MNAVVIYESLTGNTRRVGELVAARLSAEGVPTVACPITAVDYQALARADLVVVGSWVDGFFVVGQRPGRRSRIAAMPALAGKRAVVYLTYALDPGKALEKLAATVEGRGRRRARRDHHPPRPHRGGRRGLRRPHPGRGGRGLGARTPGLRSAVDLTDRQVSGWRRRRHQPNPGDRCPHHDADCPRCSSPCSPPSPCWPRPAATTTTATPDPAPPPPVRPTAASSAPPHPGSPRTPSPSPTPTWTSTCWWRWG
jgi:hypothetical protein